MYYRLAGGAVGIQAAINESLALYQLWTFLLSLSICFLFCTLVFVIFLFTHNFLFSVDPLN